MIAADPGIESGSEPDTMRYIQFGRIPVHPRYFAFCLSSSAWMWSRRFEGIARGDAWIVGTERMDTKGGVDWGC